MLSKDQLRTKDHLEFMIRVIKTLISDLDKGDDFLIRSESGNYLTIKKTSEFAKMGVEKLLKESLNKHEELLKEAE